MGLTPFPIEHRRLRAGLMMRCSTCGSRLLVRCGILICTRPGCPGHGYRAPTLKEAA